MVQYQNLTQKPELFQAPPRPGPGYDVPPEPPYRRPCLQSIMHANFGGEDHVIMIWGP